MIRPIVIDPMPSYPLGALAGLVATVLFLAVLYSGPILGTAPLDLASLIGGVLTPRPELAFGIGSALLLLGGIFVLAPLLIAAWGVLPGSTVRLDGAILKGLGWSLLVWLLTGLALPVLSALNRLPDLPVPGAFGLAAGTGTALLLALACGLYGTGLAVILVTERGISTLDSLGWDGYSHASAGPIELGIHRSSDLATPPQGGERPGRSGRPTAR